LDQIATGSWQVVDGLDRLMFFFTAAPTCHFESIVDLAEGQSGAEHF
jgi:hypothetical protein